MRFTVVSQDVMDTIQLNAGVLLSSFDPANPTVPASSSIIATTSGGINVVCEPTYQDFGEDVDNVPPNMMEFKRLTGWNCSMSFTNLKFNAANTKWALGAADTINGTGHKKIKPRADVKLSDFDDAIWWVGDKANGGAFAVCLKNVLSTGGLNIQSTKNGKGTSATTLTGHVSVNAQSVVPMEFYDLDAPALTALTVSSAAGTSSGKTALTVSGYTPGSGESYVYKTGTAAESVAYGDNLSSWSTWNGSAEITATTGNKITVAVIDSDSNAVAAGNATVTSAT